MFTDFKSQFLWCIVSTFLTGILFGASLVISNNILIILASLAILFTVLFWKTIFSRLNLQDKINSIYTDID